MALAGDQDIHVRACPHPFLGIKPPKHRALEKNVGDRRLFQDRRRPPRLVGDALRPIHGGESHVLQLPKEGASFGENAPRKDGVGNQMPKIVPLRQAICPKKRLLGNVPDRAGGIDRRGDESEGGLGRRFLGGLRPFGFFGLFGSFRFFRLRHGKSPFCARYAWLCPSRGGHRVKSNMVYKL